MKHYKHLTLSVLTLCISQQLYADTQTNTKKDVVDLGTTVVTGQKIDRSRQDTVDSVTVFNSYELEERAKADDFYDLLSQTANVVQERGFDFQIRGISTSGATNSTDGGSTIGVFVDDAVVGRRSRQAGAVSLWDVEQVEVLRGPQSTTSGRNSLAGAVHIKTKDPEFVSGGKAKLSYGSNNTYQAAVAQTGPITDKLAYRVAVDHRHTDNFITNTVFGKTDWDEETSSTVRAKLKYQADKDNSILFSASHNTFDDKGDNKIRLEQRSALETSENFLNTWETDTSNLSLKYDTRISKNWKLTGTTTHSLSRFDRDTDNDSGPSQASVLRQDTKERDTTQEFLFNYEGDKTKAVVGLYYAQGKTDDAYTVSKFLFPLGGLKSQLPPTVLAALQQQNIDLNKLNAELFLDVGTVESYENTALFFNADYKLTPNLTLITGLRADRETRKNSISAGGVRTASTGLAPIDNLVDQAIPRLGGTGSDKRTSTNVLPKLGFDYAWSDSLNTGFVVQRGYRPGGVSVNPVRGTAKEYEPEFTTNYELSLRKQSNDKKLKLNSNLFYTQWEDQQVKVQGNRGQFDITIENAAKSHLYGVELESTYQATDALALNASVGYSKTAFDDFTSRGKDYKGNEFARSRNWTGAVGAHYTHPQGYFLNTQLNYAADGYNNIANSIKIDDFLLWNAKLGYDAETWRPSIYFRNILNQEYVTERYSRFGNNLLVVGAPFTVGANVEFFW